MKSKQSCARYIDMQRNLIIKNETRWNNEQLKLATAVNRIPLELKVPSYKLYLVWSLSAQKI